MANNETKLIPNYVEADYTTALNKFKNLLTTSDTFKDFNYHGSNIAMIIELLGYVSDLANFYTNMVAKNVYIDTADVYETVHRLAQQKGYIPLGFLSSEATVTVTLSSSSYINDGDMITIDAWQTINSGQTTDDGQAIQYTLTYKVEEEASQDGLITFDIQLRQGTIDQLEYTGDDLVDNQIILPFRDYDCGMYPFDTNPPSIQVVVNDREWLRVHDFYDHISGLYPEETDVYTFGYDKYKRYYVSFASSLSVPARSDTISIKVLRSLGQNGIIGANTLSTDSYGVTDLVINNTTVYPVHPFDVTEITSFVNTEASVGGSNPETVAEVKANANANTHTQFRNVTRNDYKFHMEMRTDVVKATAWGEQEVDPGNVIEYNKVYVSCIPRMGTNSMFLEGVMDTEFIPWVDLNAPTLSASIEIPVSYTSNFENNLIQYLEPRKMISVYEVPTIPDIVYFRFDIGIRVNRAYSYSTVASTVRDKLEYFFDSINREYNEEINFMDIHNFIYDLSNVSETDDFLNIKGLDNLVIRDLQTYTVSLSGLTISPEVSGAAAAQYIYEPNVENNYPQYTQEAKEGYFDNKLRPIQLGYNQFPLLAVEMCRIYDESKGVLIQI